MSLPPRRPGIKDLKIIGPPTSGLSMRADQAVVLFFKAPHRDAAGPPLTDLGHLNPGLHHFGPVLGHHAWVSKTGGDPPDGHMIELSDGSKDSGCHMLLARLDPL